MQTYINYNILITLKLIRMKTEKTYFTIEELTHSDTANEYHIVNCPNQSQIDNMIRLIKFLNPLREA